MFREIITSSITLANSGTVIGGNIAPAVSGLTVNGDVSATGKIYGTFGDTTIQTLLSSISLSGIKGELKLDQLSAGGASLSDILKYQELVPGVSAWAPSRVLIGELSASGTLTNGSLVTYSEADKKFIAKNLEREPILESSYIKQMGKCAGSRNLTLAGGTYSPGYAAITTDDRVIAWGNLHTRIFGAAGNVLASENVRLPFWTYYDGYTSGVNYTPYGGDFLDQAANNGEKYIVNDLYWSRNGAMALVSGAADIGGDIWVAGTNTAGTLPSQANPKALVKTKFNNFLVANETGAAADTQTGGLYLFSPEKDLYAIQKYTTGAQRDIIKDLTNSADLSADSFYFISSDATIKRVTHFGELCATRTYTTSPNAFAAPNGLAMAKNDIGSNSRDLLYVCDFGTNQNKIKLFDISNNGFNFLSAIGAGVQGTSDGDTGVTQPQFHTLKKIAIDPINPRILYVTDSHRIRRLWRKDNGHYRIDTISETSNTIGDVIGELKFNSSIAKFSNPYGIKVSPDGNLLYIVDEGNKKIKVANITVNTETDFSATLSNFVDATVQTAATFSAPHDVAKDGAGNLYIADYSNHKIRKIAYDSGTTKYGLVSTFAGTGTAGVTPGSRLTAKFNGPTGITYCPTNNSLYVVNYGGHQISQINLDTNQVSIVAGAGAGFADGTGTAAKFYNPHYIKYGQRSGIDYLWISDYTNKRIRQIQFSGSTYNVTTIAGTGTAATVLSTGNAISQKIASPVGLYYDPTSDSLYFTHLHSVQKIRFSDNQLLTVIGKGIAGTVTGNANIATFNKPYNIFAKGNDLYLCDQGNFKVRKITNYSSDDPLQKVSSTFAGSSNGYKDGIWSGSQFSILRSLILDYNNTDFILAEGNLIRRIYNTGGVDYVSTIDGKSTAGNADSTISPTDWDPYGIDVDSEGDVFFSEINKDTIGSIKKDPTGGPNKVELYRRMAAGHLGIGEGSNKSTCGFIKVKAVDSVTGKEPKFKRIQFIGDDPTALLFAALDTEDSLWVWGNSADGAFGTGQRNSIGPTKLYAFENNVSDFQITCSASGRSLISVITKDGKLFSAGDNNARQLGRGETATTSPLYAIFKQCKKGANDFISDAYKLIEARETGYKNNLYINTDGNVYACGDYANGVLGREGVTVASEYFVQSDIITNVRYLIGTSNGTSYANHTIFAIKDDDTVWSWGYNGAANGQCLSNNKVLATINSPVQCYNFETKDVVRGAKYLFVNDGLPTAGQSTVGFLDSNGDLYLGGYSTDADVPDFLPSPIPYFRKFNMRNISPDVNLVGEQAIIRRLNGTVYTVNRYGAKKLF